MRTVKLITLCLLGFVANSYAQTSVKGYVYEDTNKNGKHDKNEKGIASVSVTNGREVVLTNQKGYYELPGNNDQIISVIKPSGYKIAKNADNLPQFFYIHKPNGSPNLKYKGVAPTGKLPASVDFLLEPVTEPDNFKILVFGDPQAYNMDEIGYFTNGVVKELEGIKDIAFGISMGDLVGNDPDLFNPYIQATKKIGLPWYNLMGNHDMNFDAQADSLSDESYEAHFGPANYAFNYGKVHFIVLDDILYPDPRGKSKYWGGLRKDQMEFVANDLKFVPRDKLVVLAFHIPFSKEGEPEHFRKSDRQQIFNLLGDFPYTLSLSAHTHNQWQNFFSSADGWKQEKPHHHYNVGTTSGNWYSGELDNNGIPVSTMSDGTPKGYAFISFTGNQYRANYKVAGKPESYQIEISAPKVIEYGKKTSASIYANFFMGNTKDEVLMRVDNGKWKKMENVLEADPAFLHLQYRWDYNDELLSGKRPGQANDCRHLWKASIPHKLEPGEHTIEVKATDMYGQTFTQKKTYRIVKR
ncbi:calcineurin-like phosphoesterase family protein [Pseudopedobacter sp.]|uniref:calcineurin-like phosphoesterase family protein n=1 Tax=Pseudopedobacter sp. TaxID=1936787 RepID=UPI0033400D13